VVHVSNTAEPIYFLPRLVTFALIATAIVNKNAPGKDRKAFFGAAPAERRSAAKTAGPRKQEPGTIPY
jgi:hypothetical protein